MSDSTGTTRELHMTKECSEYTGLPGSFCTITASNIEAIPVGSKVVYDAAATDKTVDSDVTIVFGDERLVSGHVVFDIESNTGILALTEGAGELSGFVGAAVVTSDGGVDASWDGTYSLAATAATV